MRAAIKKDDGTGTRKAASGNSRFPFTSTSTSGTL
jgi:hypothetical protein